MRQLVQVHLILVLSWIGSISRSHSQDFWTQTNGPFEPYVRAMAINAYDDLFVETDFDGGMFRSTDGGEEWVQINNGLDDLSIWSVAINQENAVFAGTYNGLVYRSTDNGDSWASMNAPCLGMATIDIAIGPNGSVFAGVDGLGFLRSTDDGESWQEVTNGFHNLTGSSNKIDEA